MLLDPYNKKGGGVNLSFLKKITFTYMFYKAHISFLIVFTKMNALDLMNVLENK